MWALRRTAVHEFLRPGPCVDSPRIGWDGLEMERLPPPVDQAGSRPGADQRGSGGDGGGGGGGGNGGTSMPTPLSHSENRGGGGDGSTPAVAGGRADVSAASSVTTMFRIVRRGRAASNASGGSGNIGSSGSARSRDAGSGSVYRVATAEGIRVRRGADPQSAEVAVIGEGAELVVAEELHDGNGGVWMRLSTPVEGWIGKRNNSLVAMSRASPQPGTAADSSSRESGGSGGGALPGPEGDGNETGEAAEIALAKELEDCMEEEAGTDLYRRDDRLFGSRQGWSLPSGGTSGTGVGGRGSDSGSDSRVPGERRAAVVGHASVSGCWAAVGSMSVTATKEKLAGTAATLAVLHCRKILLTVLLQCHKEVTRTAVGGQAAADTLLSQRVGALVGARDSPSAPSSTGKANGEAASGRSSSGTLRTRVAARQFSSFLQLVLFRGWRPEWWPISGGGDWRNKCLDEGEGAGDEDERICLDDKEPMSDRFRSLPVVLTPLVLCLIRAAAAQRSAAANSGSESAASEGVLSSGAGGCSSPALPCGQSFDAQVEEAMLQSVASQLRQATRIGHRDQAWASSDAAEMNDAHCLRYPRLRYVMWAARIVQAGSGAPTVPQRVFHAWATGLRSPSLPVKQQVCSELSRLLNEAVQAVDRARRACIAAPASASGGAETGPDVVDASAVDAIVVATASDAAALQREMATQRLRQCVDLLPLARLRSLAERRMLKEGEDEPMLSRVLQSIVDLVASAELACRVLRESDAEEDEKRKCDEAALAAAGKRTTSITATDSRSCNMVGTDRDKDEGGRAVLCFPTPSAYVALQGRDLEPPWTAEFWVLRPNPDGTWEDEDTGKSASPSGGSKQSRGVNGGDGTSPLSSDSVASASAPAPVLDPVRSPVPRRGLSKSYSERLPSPPSVLSPSMARAISTPSCSVDLSQLPPADPKEGAPTLFRARSADAVGQDDSGRPRQGQAEVGVPCAPGDNAPRRAETGEKVGADLSDDPPLPSSAGRPSLLEQETIVGATAAAAVTSRTERGNASRSSDSNWWAGRPPSFAAAYVPHEAAGTGGQKSRSSPWWDRRSQDTQASDGGGGVGSGASPAADDQDGVGKADATASAESERSRKGEMATAPAEFLASSQTGHIKIQAGGTVFTPSVGQFHLQSVPAEQDGNVVTGGSSGGNSLQDEDRPVHSEALCVSMGATGEKERAFDFVVPTGRWVHLAIAASPPSEGRTTLYVDGVAVDTISLRMSLPMGCLGASPHAQESSAAVAAGGGSFVGLLAQTR